MPRNSFEVRRRLQHAGFELFHERGYDRTTAAEIAARAGVTERTFFRHFADKREVPFASSDDLRARLVEKILEAPNVTKPLQLVATMLAEFEWESFASRYLHRRRHKLITANPALVERELMKYQSLALAFADALRQRGVAPVKAQLAARVGIDVFVAAYTHWLSENDDAGLVTITISMMSALATMAKPSSSSRRSQ